MNEPGMPSNPSEEEMGKGALIKKSIEKGAEKSAHTTAKDDSKTIAKDDSKTITKKRTRRTKKVNGESPKKGTDNGAKKAAKKEDKKGSKTVFGFLKKKKAAGKVPEGSGDSKGSEELQDPASKPEGIKKYLQTFEDLLKKLSGRKKDQDADLESSGKAPGSGKKPTLADKYKALCFRFGLHFDKNPQNDLAKSLYQADLEMTPGMFISLAVVTSFLASILMFFISSLVFWGSESPLVYIFSLTFLTFVLCLGGFPFTLYNKVSNKDMNIEHEIPFALSYMSILASGGSSPVELIRRVSEEDYGDVSQEFSKVMFRIDVLGEDGNSAMSHLIRNTSSELLRTICIDLANAMQAGGGLRTYLEMKSKELMEMRRETQKVFVDSLSVYGEGYLSGIVMSVVLVVLMIVICSALGIDLKFMTPHQLFNFFVYFGLPFMNIMFILLLWMKYSRNAI